jgi:tRNA pseudouridine38-40 synthase
VRHSAVTVAPPHGLTLIGVDYPPPEGLAVRAQESKTRRSG